MTEAHQLAAIAVSGVTVAMAAVAVWSWITARRSSGAADHRFAVDRTLLIVVGLFGLNVAIGGLVLATGGLPADPLHLLYGAAGLVTLPTAWWWGGRGGRRHRDGWVALGALVLVGIAARLFLTG
jgi:hypothetical protein